MRIYPELRECKHGQRLCKVVIPAAFCLNNEVDIPVRGRFIKAMTGTQSYLRQPTSGQPIMEEEKCLWNHVLGSDVRE